MSLTSSKCLCCFYNVVRTLIDPDFAAVTLHVAHTLLSPYFAFLHWMWLLPCRIHFSFLKHCFFTLQVFYNLPIPSLSIFTLYISPSFQDPLAFAILTWHFAYTLKSPISTIYPLHKVLLCGAMLLKFYIAYCSNLQSPSSAVFIMHLVRTLRNLAFAVLCRMHMTQTLQADFCCSCYQIVTQTLHNPSFAVFALYVAHNLQSPISAVFILHVAYTKNLAFAAVFIVCWTCLLPIFTLHVDRTLFHLALAGFILHVATTSHSRL